MAIVQESNNIQIFNIIIINIQQLVDKEVAFFETKIFALAFMPTVLSTPLNMTPAGVYCQQKLADFVLTKILTMEISDYSKPASIDTALLLF